MKKSIQEHPLEKLERDFNLLLVACLKEGAEERRWGLFGQNDHPETAKYLRWDEAYRLKEMAIEIQELRAEWGTSNPSVEKFLEYCSQRGENLPGEPKRASKLLNELISI